MEKEKSRMILDGLDKIDWIAYKEPREVRTRDGTYLEVEMMDDTLHGGVLRALYSIAYLAESEIRIFIKNSRFKVRFHVD
jgi:hypothetical protein